MMLRKILRDPVVIVVAFILFGLVAGSYLPMFLPAHATETEEKQQPQQSTCRIAGFRMPVFTREMTPLMPIYRAVNRRLSPLREELAKSMPQRDIPARCPRIHLPRVPQLTFLYHT